MKYYLTNSRVLFLSVLGATVLVSGHQVAARLAEVMLTKLTEIFQGVLLREQLRVSDRLHYFRF